MKKAGIIVGIVVLIIVVVAIIASGNGSPTDTGSPSENGAPPENGVTEPETFSPITFIGASDKTTAPFEVTTIEWVIDWSYIPDPEYPEYAVFGFYVYPRGETVMYVEAVLFPESTSGTTYSYAGIGEYYIAVGCANVQSWEITISPPS